MRIDKGKIAQPTPSTWTFTDKEKLFLQASFLLENMVNHDYTFPNVLPMNLRIIEDAIQFLEEKKLIEQTTLPSNPKKILGITYGYELPDWVYSSNEKGRQFTKALKKKYLEFVRIYDVFAHVDPDRGTFAMEEMSTIILELGEETYQQYLDLERWIDYRIPVLHFKGIDPRPLVFYAKIHDGDYVIDPLDTDYKWAIKLYLDEFWNDIYAILKHAPRWEEHGFEDVGPKKIMKQIIKQGFGVLKEQHDFLNNHARQQEAILQDEQPRPSNGARDINYFIPPDDYLEQYYAHPMRYVGNYHHSILNESFWHKFSSTDGN